MEGKNQSNKIFLIIDIVVWSLVKAVSIDRSRTLLRDDSFQMFPCLIECMEIKRA